MLFILHVVMLDVVYVLWSMMAVFILHVLMMCGYIVCAYDGCGYVACGL